MVDLLRSSCRDDMMILEVYGLTMAPVGGALVHPMVWVGAWRVGWKFLHENLTRIRRMIETVGMGFCTCQQFFGGVRDI